MSTTTPIRELRLHRRLSLDELGHRAGIERSKLSRAERGYIHLDEDELLRLAAELGVVVGRLRDAVARAGKDGSRSTKARR